MTNEKPKIGIGVIVVRDGKVLVGKRISPHGYGTWSFPGGHLEMFESIEDCARRETKEETGLDITHTARGPFIEDVFEETQKHYVTLYIIAKAPAGEPKVMEPDKCEKWEWFEWDNLPQPLFMPIENLIQTGYSPFE